MCERGLVQAPCRTRVHDAQRPPTALDEDEKKTEGHRGEGGDGDRAGQPDTESAVGRSGAALTE